MDEHQTKKTQAATVFISSALYPRVHAGVLTTQQEQDHDNPKGWFNAKWSKNEIIAKRRELTNAFKDLASVQIKSSFISHLQDIAMAKKAPDCLTREQERVAFQRLPNVGEAVPYGSRAKLETLELQESPKANDQLQKAFLDTDALASESVNELYAKKLDQYAITRLFSVAGLGVERRRKLVPTRWSITAIDDILCKPLIEQILTNSVCATQVFTSSYLGNHFLILFFEHAFCFEFLEIWNGKIDSDYELASGRSQYAYTTAGGYYAARLAVCEYLAQHKQQAAVVVIRFIAPEYDSSLGVWVIRETIKEALSKPSLEFSQRQLLIQYAIAYAHKKWKYDGDAIVKASKVIPILSTQSSLKDFFG